MKTIFLSMSIFVSVLISAQTDVEEMPAGNNYSNQKGAEINDNIWYAFQNRRSVRQFKPDSVPHADILKIIDAARMAPTSGNQQPWKFLVIRDKIKIEELKKACINNSFENLTTEEKQEYAEVINEVFEKYFSAPVYIVILTDNNSIYSDYNHWDGALAAGYLMLAARALGYGTVFITDAVPDMITQKVLNIPSIYTRVCITPVGVPKEWPNSPPKKQLKEFIVYDNF